MSFAPFEKKMILIPNQGPAPKAIVLKAFAEAIRIAGDLGLKEITLLVPSKSSLDATFFGGFLSAAACSKLKKPGKKIALNGLAVQCESPRTIKEAEGVVLAIYLASGDLENLQTTSFGIKGVVFVPWLNEEATAWYAAWKPVVIGKLPPVPQSTLPATVQTELVGLTNSVNLTTGSDTKPTIKRRNQCFGF